MTGPGVVAAHKQVAANGVVAVVATAVQPAIATPAAVKLTAPATLVVAMMPVGPWPTIALPPLRTAVGVVVAADAAVTPTVATLARAMAPTASPDINLFISHFLLFGWLLILDG
jgi:hypothetical protein